MKKLLLFALMAVLSLNVSAQLQKFDPSGVTLSKQRNITNKPQTQRSYQAAPFKDMPVVNLGHIGKKLTLDVSRLQPVQRTTTPVMNQRQAKMMNTKGRLANGLLNNLKPTMTVQANAPRKAPTFRDSYMGKATDYFSKSDTAWVMQPAVATLEDGSSVNVLVDIIPLEPQLKEALSSIYPNGVPVEYTMEDGAITIMPQAIASYEAEGVRNYITLFSANSDDEDGSIRMQLADDGLLKVVDGNWIALGEFAGVPFDEEMGDSEAYLGLDELYAGVRYVYDGQKQGFTAEREYNAHGVDYSEKKPLNWIMGLGTWTEDGEETPVFLNLSPLSEIFSTLYPDGIYVEYKKQGNTYTIEPQVIASARNEDGTTDYIILFSGTNEDTGEIVFEIDADGKLTTIKDESILIAAWSTNKYDPTFNTYLGYYTYTDRVSYRLPNEPAEAPADLGVDPNELVLFAGLALSGYSYNSNLGIIGAYTPLTFNNTTFDVATGYEWKVTEMDDEEQTITGTDTDFTFNTKGNAVYTDLMLTAYNDDAVSDPYTFGYGHCPETDANGNPTGNPEYEAAYFYAGQTASSFEFTDGSMATMTRQNPDNDLTFYINWATPDILVPEGGPTINKIYSYQGKPATPLFLTGVTIPMVSFEAKEDFNLHIGLYKCKRSATGRLTMGDIIAEGDATIENIDDQYDRGLTAVNFDELYVENEEGMSETLDYLFIEDEFVIVIDGIDNGTFSGVIGSQDIDGNDPRSAWFTSPGDNSLRAYGYNPSLFIGLLDAAYGYLYTEDNTNLTFGAEGGTATIHVDPMLYSIDDETEEPTYSLYLESVKENGEEADDTPAWLTVEVANEDYTTATTTDESGETYEYFVNGIDYDLVFTAEPLPEDVESRTAEIVYAQTGALLKVTIAQSSSQGITTVVTKKPLNNRHTYNLAGQRIGSQKGIVVKDGRKVIRK